MEFLLFLLFHHAVVSDSLRPHGQHARLPHPLLCPGACLNSCPLSWWCHPTISFSAALVSSCSQSFPAEGLFQWVTSLHQLGKVLELQIQHHFFQWIFRVDWIFRIDWFDLLAVQGTPNSLLQHHSSKPSILQCSAFFMVWLSATPWTVLHRLPELAQIHVHWVGDAIQPSHLLLPSSPFAFSLSQHQSLFKWVSFSHQVAKVLEFQLQHQSFQWIFRTDFL